MTRLFTLVQLFLIGPFISKPDNNTNRNAKVSPDSQFVWFGLYPTFLIVPAPCKCQNTLFPCKAESWQQFSRTTVEAPAAACTRRDDCANDRLTFVGIFHDRKARRVHLVPQHRAREGVRLKRRGTR